MCNNDFVVGAFYDTIKKSKAVAYCPWHKWYLTEKQLKNLNCLGRKCKQLERVEHNFWNERKLKRERRKARKDSIRKFSINHPSK